MSINIELFVCFEKISKCLIPILNVSCLIPRYSDDSPFGHFLNTNIDYKANIFL